MENEYKHFLENKGTGNFWKKAKQKEYTSDAVNKIHADLTTDFNQLTTRNSITLRYLGLVINLGGDKLQISNAGETFLHSPYKQKILDEQVMKVYLDCAKLNDNLSIKVAPMEVLLHILYTLDHITFDEYRLFVCWINSKDEIPTAIKLIEEFRVSPNKDTYLKMLDEKSQELGIGDFADNVKRFFDMLLISSYIQKDTDNKIVSNLSKKDIEVVLESFSVRDFSDEGYFPYLTSNNGWQIYTLNPNYLRVIENLEKRTTEEQEEIINKLVGEPTHLPDIDSVHPQSVNIEIDEDVDTTTLPRKRAHVVAHKIDFELRDGANRAAGDFAEKIVIKYEIEELSKTRPDLASQVKQVSLESDMLGYDILSFNADGSEKNIEVKAVKSKPGLTFRFYISENEVLIAQKNPNYHFYIVFDYTSPTPLIYRMPNPFVDEILGVTIMPIKYLVTVKIKK